jgi:hypothetical protein
LSDHAKPMSDRADLGHRIFLAGFFLPLAVGASTATIGYGLTRNIWLPIVGVANVLALMVAANALYGGSKAAERAVKAIGAVLLIAAVVVFFAVPGLAGIFLGVQTLMFVILAAAVATPSAHRFFAYQRNEVIVGDTDEGAEVAEVESILVGGALREEAKAGAITYSRVLGLAGGLLALACIAGVGLGIGMLVYWGYGWSLIFASLFAMPSAPVLLTLSDRWKFLATTKGYEKVHLANIATDSQTLVNCASVSAVMLALLAVLELMMR